MVLPPGMSVTVCGRYAVSLLLALVTSVGITPVRAEVQSPEIELAGSEALVHVSSSKQTSSRAGRSIRRDAWAFPTHAAQLVGRTRRAAECLDGAPAYRLTLCGLHVRIQV